MFRKKLDSGASYQGQRNSFILFATRNQSVIHIGCTDWPFLADEIDNNRLFHHELENSTKQVLGIDIDRLGIEALKKISQSLSFEVGDVSDSEFRASLLKEYGSVSWDWVLVPDVLEHVRNQEIFLRGIVSLSQNLNAKIMITTPNQYSLKAFLATLLRMDFTHTDHRLVHNEVTIMRALLDVGVKEHQIKFLYAAYNISRRYGLLLQALSGAVNMVLRMFPHWADCLVVIIEE